MQCGEISADAELISTGKAEALVSTAENLLTQVGALAKKIETDGHKAQHSALENLQLSLPQNVLSHNIHTPDDTKEIRFH